MPTVAALAAPAGHPRADHLALVVNLAVALGLCALIGLEREYRRKSAGLRTHATVGLATAAIAEVSKWGFGDVLGPSVTLDPSRVAAQVVSGIGFIGAGIIFVRRDSVRGLTTAAAVWLSAAVGLAAGTGLLWIALATTVGYFLVVVVLGEVEQLLPIRRPIELRLDLTYHSGRGVLPQLLAVLSAHSLVVSEFRTRDPSAHPGDDPGHGSWAGTHSVAGSDEASGHDTAAPDDGVTEVAMLVSGALSVEVLVPLVRDLPDVISVDVSTVGDQLE